jgi:hypothetical protein
MFAISPLRYNYAKLVNAGLNRDQRYRTGLDTGMQLTSGKNADAGLTLSRLLHMFFQHHKVS